MSNGSSSTAIVVRQSVTPSLPYEAYRQELREDFWWSCAYCSITEVEGQGVSFEIDHYQPQARGGGDEYDNLMYSCDTCNGLKSAWLSNVAAYKIGVHVIRIDKENPADHLELHEDRESLDFKTKTGDHNIKLLDLNRAPLKRVRNVRNRLNDSQDVVTLGLRLLANIRLDQLPKKHRALVLKHRQRIQSELGLAVQTTQGVIEALSRSELLDPDPDKVERARVRRKHLQELRAILPDQVSPNRKKKRVSGRSTKKKKKRLKHRRK